MENQIENYEQATKFLANQLARFAKKEVNASELKAVAASMNSMAGLNNGAVKHNVILGIKKVIKFYDV